jgi:hypothetical protein
MPRSCPAVAVLPSQDVYGFDMSPIAEEVRKGELDHAGVHVVNPSDIITEDVQVKVRGQGTGHGAARATPPLSPGLSEHTRTPLLQSQMNVVSTSHQCCFVLCIGHAVEVQAT